MAPHVPAGVCAPARPMRLAAAPRHVAMCRYSSLVDPDREALSPAQCMAALEKALADGAALSGIVIAGPGDPLAETGRTLDLLFAVRALAPDLPVRLVTAGLGLPPALDALREAGVDGVTLQVNAVSPEMAAALYAWVRPGVRTLRAAEGAAALLAGQAEAMQVLRDAGLPAEVEFLLVPGVNGAHLHDVASWAAARGAVRFSVLPARSSAVPHTAAPHEPDDAAMAAAVTLAGGVLPAVDGRPCAAHGEESDEALDESGLYDAAKPYVAVATSDGVNVDVHLGKAEKLLLYDVRQGEVALAGSRACPPKGGGEGRWEALADVLADCRALIAASAGESPRQALLARGLPVVTGSTTVEEAASRIFGVAANMGIVRGR